MINFTKNWSVKKFLTNIEKGKVTFDHPIQRKSGQWDILQQSYLIHSILIDYPVPPIFSIKEDEESGTLSIIDGKQRLMTLQSFKNDEFKLSKETPEAIIDGEQYEIAGLKYSQLSEELQNIILDFNLTVNMMSDATDDDIEEVFFRLNNGTALTKDQRTRVRLGNRLAEFIDEVTTLSFFKEKAYFTKAQIRRGEDQTCVLQTIMLLKDYDIKSFNNDDVLEFAEWYRDNYTDEELEKYKNLFNTMYEILPYTDKPIKMIKKINIPAFIMMLNYSIENDVNNQKYLDWIQEFINDYNPECPYAQLCGQSSISKRKVEARVQYMYKSFNDYLDRFPVIIPNRNGCEESGVA